MEYTHTNTYAPNRIAPLKQATRDMFRSLHKQYLIATKNQINHLKIVGFIRSYINNYTNEI
jgi:hypothetical protein